MAEWATVANFKALQARVEKEEKRSKAADSGLGTQLNAEEGKRYAGDGVLTERIATVEVKLAALEAKEEPSPEPEPPAAPGGLFAPDSYVNRVLPDSAPLAANSTAYVNAVAAMGVYDINSSEYGVPVYVASKNDPVVSVRVEDGSNFPGPPKAPGDVWKPAAGSDRHLTVWIKDADELVEYWNLRQVGSEWVAGAGARMQHVSTNPGYIDQNAYPGAQTWWGATAAAIPLLAGLITEKEAEEASIPHALAAALPSSITTKAHVWPAQRHDGGGNPVPEGTIFRLPYGTASSSNPFLRAIEVAAEKHGIFTRDQTSNSVSLYMEDVTRFGGHNANYFFGLTSMRAFPWSKLVAIQPEH